MTLEDKLQAQETNYESELERKLNKKSSWLKIALDTLLYTPVLAASSAAFGPAITLSTAIPAIGYTIGAWWEKKKQGLKMTWNGVKKELYTGNIMGHVDYALFSAPELLFNAYPKIFNAGTFTSKLLSTFVFNPILFVPVNIAYGAFFYLRDKIGWKNTFKGLFNGKIGNYAKSAYRNIKENLWTDTKNVFKYMFPLHFFQMHYLTNITQKIPLVNEMPVAAARMTQSALVNNPIYRIVMGKQSKDEYKMIPNVSYA